MVSTAASPTDFSLHLPQGLVAARAWGDQRGKPVLAIHGWLDNAASFDVIAPYLLEIYQQKNPYGDGLYLVAIDCYGHGKSSHYGVGQTYTVWNSVRDAFQIADVLGWKDFSLLGHSMGAAITSLMAGTFPDRIKALGLIEVLGPFSSQPKNAPEQLAKSISAQIKQQSKQPSVYPDKESMVVARQFGFSEVTREAAELLVERGLVKVRGGYSWSSDMKLRIPTMQYLVEDQTTAFLKHIQAKTLLMFGDKGMFSANNFQDRIDCVEEIDVKEFPGSHHLHMEQAASDMAACLAELYTFSCATSDKS